MFGIKKLFNENDLIETGSGYKTICPDCGLQGGRTEGFILFPETNMAYCHSSQKKFNVIETYALKKKIIRCIDGRDENQKHTALKGDLYKQTLEQLQEEFSEEDYHDILLSVNIKRDIELPNNGKLISQFAKELADKIKREEIFFYRSDTKRVVEIGKIKHPDGNIVHSGFVDVEPNRFVTIIERYFAPWCTVYTKSGSMVVKKSMPQNIGNIVLVSDDFRDSMPIINRIFFVQIPILWRNESGKIELTFPKKGYDRRFGSWLPYNSPTIENENMELQEALEVLDYIFSEFCFKTEQDKTNAIAGFITPFLRGLFPTFNTRTPVFIYEANRERAGKDYLAGLTGILYEGFAVEEPPISTNDRYTNNSDELRKKILSAMISGRKRLHFSNNKGYLNNSAFESIITNEKNSDRVLGKSEVLSFDNELDFSLSGNIGMTLTPDLANRARFVRLFLEMENANERKFSNPDLHLWLKENRNVVLSALYAIVKNWINSDMKKGSLPFSSFPHWADKCGGVMEAAGLGNPCVMDNNTSGIAVDGETSEMKGLFELCYDVSPNTWLKKEDIVKIIKEHGEDLFSDYDWDRRSDQTKFGTRLIKYVGRIFSAIKLRVKDNSTRPSRWEYKFEKESVIPKKSIVIPKNLEENAFKSTENGNLGNLGNFRGHFKSPIYTRVYAIGQTEVGSKVAKVAKVTKSDREVQFWEAEECKDIVKQCTKEQTFEWIKKNPNFTLEQMYKELGIGCFEFRTQLRKEGLI